MKNNAVLEALLRPPVEIWSAATAWSVTATEPLVPRAARLAVDLGHATQEVERDRADRGVSQFAAALGGRVGFGVTD